MLHLITRNLIHILFGLSILLILSLFPTVAKYLLTFISILLLILDYLRKKNKWWKNTFHKLFDTLLKDSEKKGQITGATMFLITSAILSNTFPNRITEVSILILTFADPFASIVGNKISLKNIWRKKTLGGSLSFFVVSLLILNIYFHSNILYLVICALIVTIIELFSGEFLENFLIGFIAAILITLLSC